MSRIGILTPLRFNETPSKLPCDPFVQPLFPTESDRLHGHAQASATPCNSSLPGNLHDFSPKSQNLLIARNRIRGSGPVEFFGPIARLPRGRSDADGNFERHARSGRTLVADSPTRWNKDRPIELDSTKFFQIPHPPPPTNTYRPPFPPTVPQTVARNNPPWYEKASPQDQMCRSIRGAVYVLWKHRYASNLMSRSRFQLTSNSKMKAQCPRHTGEKTDESIGMMIMDVVSCPAKAKSVSIGIKASRDPMKYW